MVDIFRDADTHIWREEDGIVVSQRGGEQRIPIQSVETVAELSPCVTMGRYVDLRVVTVRVSGGPILYIPVTKEGAKQILTGIQQCKLNALRHVAK